MKSFNLLFANLNFAAATIPGNPLVWVNILAGFGCLLAFGVIITVEISDMIEASENE